MSDGRVCAVCARVLNHDTFRGWVHTLQDSQPEDHPPVPVAPSDVYTTARCDFCSEDNPGWTVPARTFTALPGHNSAGDWAACDACVKHVQADRWDALVDRVISRMHRQGIPASPDALSRLYRKLRRNFRGAPFRTSQGPAPRER